MAQEAHNHHPDECRNVWRQWAGFLDKELSAEESARVRTHLERCGHCREFVDSQAAFDRVLRNSLAAKAAAMPDALRSKVLAALEHSKAHTHGHEHHHGEPGHVHDHSHPHIHSHGPNLATRAALAVLSVGLALALFLFFAQRGRNEVLNERVTALEAQMREAKGREGEAASLQKQLQQLKLDRATAEFERDEARRQSEEWRRKYDESVLMAEKLQRALSALVAASAAVMERDEAMKPVTELEKKWATMFPRIGAMPHKSGDMDPRLWDVTPIEGEDVLWVVFSKKGDPKSQFTLMTFTEAYLKRHFDGLAGMCETVKDGKTVLAWPNAKDAKVYHALISTADLKTAREQLQALR